MPIEISQWLRAFRHVEDIKEVVVRYIGNQEINPLERIETIHNLLCRYHDMERTKLLYDQMIDLTSV